MHHTTSLPHAQPVAPHFQQTISSWPPAGTRINTALCRAPHIDCSSMKEVLVEEKWCGKRPLSRLCSSCILRAKGSEGTVNRLVLPCSVCGRHSSTPAQAQVHDTGGCQAQAQAEAEAWAGIACRSSIPAAQQGAGRQGQMSMHLACCLSACCNSAPSPAAQESLPPAPIAAAGARQWSCSAGVAQRGAAVAPAPAPAARAAAQSSPRMQGACRIAARSRPDCSGRASGKQRTQAAQQMRHVRQLLCWLSLQTVSQL